jgi:hypothetical protein
MDNIQLLLLPLGVFWVSFSSLLTAASFVNEMRETIVAGTSKAGRPLSVQHRKTMFLDWCLSMILAITASLIFSCLIFWIAIHIRHQEQLRSVAGLLMAVAAFPLLASIGLSVCGTSDFRLIQRTLRKAQAEEEKRTGAPGANASAAHEASVSGEALAR